MLWFFLQKTCLDTYESKIYIKISLDKLYKRKKITDVAFNLFSYWINFFLSFQDV